MSKKQNGGLYAYRPVACPKVPTYLQNHFLAEGFLSPIPNWATNNEYFGDLGRDLIGQFIGDIILRVEIPNTFSSIYIDDYAHILECKSTNAPLNLGYNCSFGTEVTQAYINSYISAHHYKGGHIAPIVQLTRKNSGIIVPNRYISVYNLA